MRSDLRITFPQEVDKPCAFSVCCCLVLPLLFPGPCAEGVRRRPCPRGRLGAPGAVPVLRGRRAADRLSCRPGTLAPSRAPAAPRIYALPQAEPRPSCSVLNGGYPSARRYAPRCCARDGCPLGRPARGAVLLVRKSRLLHRACPASRCSVRRKPGALLYGIQAVSAR